MTAPPLAARFRAVALPYATLRLSGQGAELIGWVVLARRLAPEAFGRLTIAFLVCRYVGLVADYGALSQGARIAANDERDAIRSLVRVRTRLAAGLAGAAATGVAAGGHPDLAPVAGVALGLGLARDWLALGRAQGVRAAVPMTVQGGLLLAGAASAADARGGALAVAGGYGAAAIASVVLNRLPPGAGPDGAPRHPPAWSLAAFLAVQVTSTADTVLLGALRSPGEAGVYAAVYRIPNAWIAVLSAVLGAALPLASTAWAQGPSAYARLRRRSLRASGAAGAATAAAAPAALVAVPLLFGEDYGAGRLPAVLLILATAVITFGAPLHPLVIATGDDRRYATIVVTAAVVNVGANLVLIPPLGMTGAALATGLAQLATTGWLWGEALDRTRDRAG